MLQKLTPYQEKKLVHCFVGYGESMGAVPSTSLLPSKDVHVKAAAGCGKTFLALHMMLRVLEGDPKAVVLFGDWSDSTSAVEKVVGLER